MLATIRTTAMIVIAVITVATAPSAMASDIGRTAAIVVPASSPSAPIAATQFVSTPVVQGAISPPPTGSAPVVVAAGSSPSLNDLVVARTGAAASNADQECIAAAVYFEARGEPVEGQLAVAEVVLNRAASGRYPASICAVVTQRAQFSFVRRGRIPPIAKATEAWRKALAIAQVAGERLAQQISSTVLWYHANYVSPQWGRRLTRVAQIGAHIFYRENG